MGMINTLVVLAAIAWVGWVLVSTRYQLRNAGIVSPPMFASTVLFALGLMVGLVLGAAPLHLLWWFPLSAILGGLLMVFPAWTRFNMACLGLLAGLNSRQDSSNKP